MTGASAVSPMPQDEWDPVALLDQQTGVLERISRGAPLGEILSDILTSLEDLMPRAHCSILLYDAARGTLHHGAAPTLPSSYTGRIEGMSIGPRAGSCGTAVYQGSPVVVEDIASDPRWEVYGPIALEHGLRSCWSTPIEGRSGITGTFAVYYEEPSTPQGRDRVLVQRYTHVASIAIDQAALIESEVARRAAEVASRNKSEFVAALSHDIRTPLQTIVGMTEMVRGVDMPAERRQAALELMARAASHITELVDDVLDLSRIEAGSLPLRISDVDVEPLLREVRDIVEPVARDRSVTIEVVPGSAVVRADPRRLRQVLINLLTNAAVHNTAGGHARLESSQDGADVVISLTDDGPGIPRERLDRLFVPFERLGADDRDVPGAGLGLPLALALTEAMSGTLVVDSAVGRGTTVTVRLPAGGSASGLARNVQP